MRLSEAIRLGATMKPQGFGQAFTPDGGSCALGAALDAIGVPQGYPFNIWPEMIKEILFWQDCPECGRAGAEIRLSMPAHLNDTHRWTRERIADFVELHEPLPTLSGTVVNDENVVEQPATTAVRQS